MEDSSHFCERLEDELIRRILQGTHEGEGDQNSRTVQSDRENTERDEWRGFKVLPQSIAYCVSNNQTSDSTSRTIPKDATLEENLSINLLSVMQDAPNGALLASPGRRVRDTYELQTVDQLVTQCKAKTSKLPVASNPRENSIPKRISEDRGSTGSEGTFGIAQKEVEEARPLSLKQIIRRENNRAAARRSNMKRKLEKQAQKRELAVLRQMEEELRAKECQLRQENLWLRALVFPDGYPR